MKIAGTVSSLGCDITIIGRRSGDCCNSDSMPFRTKRFRMIFKRGFFFYKFFNIRLFTFLLFHKFDILVSNDLDTLLPNFLVSRMKQLPLVYDSHEYFTGVPEIQNRPFVKWIWKSIEKSMFPCLKYVMTVSDSIALQYEKEYGRKPVTVRNCSMKTEQIIPFLRKELEVNPDHLLLILQGTGINADRGGVELIDAVSLTENVSLLIIGSGNQFDILIEKVLKLKLSDRIKIIAKCPWETLMRYTRSADAGLSLDKNSNLNYSFSFPNKLFDYISAGIPVIATELPEIAKILNEYKCGILISKPDPIEISKAIIRLRDDRRLLSELKQNSVIASKSVNWDNESLKVEELYKSIINNK
ncbi:MAG: glycosyltransferase [Bacteroidales bacterium]|jgi:glycosyltransferase involved in cell wall biosynthesis